MCCCRVQCGGFTGFVRGVLIAVGIAAVVFSTISFVRIMKRTPQAPETAPIVQPAPIEAPR